MSLAISTLEDVTIANGASTSRAVLAYPEYHDALTLQLDGPAALDVLTFTIQTADDDAFTTNVRTVQVNDPPTDLAPPAATKTRVYFVELSRLRRWRIKSSGNVAADRTWKVSKSWS